MKIRTVDFVETCWDGCCTHWGTRLWWNDAPIQQTSSDQGEALAYVLEQIGYEVEHDFDEE